jgi:hypothetical protein
MPKWLKKRISSKQVRLPGKSHWISVSWKRDRDFQIGKFLSSGISSFLELVSLASFGPSNGGQQSP